MRRIYVTVEIEGGDTIEDLAEMVDLSVTELLKFNPRLYQIFQLKTVPGKDGYNSEVMSSNILASVQIKVIRTETYPSSIQLGYN